MKYCVLLFVFSGVFVFSAKAQTAEDSVKAVINDLFTGMRNSDTSAIRNAFHEKAILQAIVSGKDGQVAVREKKVADFINSVGTPHKEIYDERIRFEAIKIDGPLAIAWTPYRFYVGSTFSHCGVNSFQLVKIKGQWKIQYIIDTRRRKGCEE
jgi:Putative lumazine-binding